MISSVPIGRSESLMKKYDKKIIALTQQSNSNFIFKNLVENLKYLVSHKREELFT